MKMKSQRLIGNRLLTRREFVKTSAKAAAVGLAAGALRPLELFGAGNSWEADGYNHKAVVRVYDPAVASTYHFGDPFYWRKFDAARLQNMLETGLMELSNTATVRAAWAKILPGVSGASRVVVKVNFNNTRRDWKTTALNSSPALMVALTRSLNQAGVQNGGITFLDCSRPFPSEMKGDVLAQCPGVQCAGGPQAGSAASQAMPTGGAYVIPQLVMDADFLISAHLMKKHEAGPTGAIKNLFGMKADGIVSEIAHAKPPWTKGPQCRNIITNPEIKQRLKLCINEAILAGKTPNTLDPYQFTDMFPGGKPSSLFLSRNPFLQDAVEWDFVRAECSRFPGQPGDNIIWLRNCAGAEPAWATAALESGTVVNGAPGLPPKDMSYDSALVRFISRPAAGAPAARAEG